ncbi:hypothetical protein [Paraburkholderia saeva]|uniref:hypothetical protein n=1 Tax=Paraburkholderia saeva TaxID=2777537 RepID=UPI001D47FD04|nr:hypothetical protein [Paraburkholderia saeva]CAG4887904.1 hypothetical protein R52603_00535 [Paraburkholderia saeva]
MKAPWDHVKFRLSKTQQDPAAPRPEAGDEMRTCTGRRYQILKITPKSVTCLVLPKDAKVQGKVWIWEWNSSKH